MAFIRTRKTKLGLTYHLVDKTLNKCVHLIGVRSRTEANQYLYKYLGDQAENRPNSLFTEKVLFREFVETKYLPYSQANKTDKTKKVHKNELRILMEEFGFCKLNLSQITTERIEMFKLDCMNKGLSKKTINNRLALISPILKMAYKYQLIMRMPEIKLLKLDILPPRGLDDKTVNALLSTAMLKDKLVYDFVLVFLHTGMRLSELTNLRWDDVNFQNRQLIIRKAKSHKFRAIPLNSILESHLFDLRKRNMKAIFVFEHEGRQFHANSFDRRYRAIVRSAGIIATIHGLRHTFASRLVQNGVTLYEVQKLLGHSTVSTTERYAHLRMDNLVRAVSVLEKLNIGCTTGVPSTIATLKIA